MKRLKELLVSLLVLLVVLLFLFFCYGPLVGDIAFGEEVPITKLGVATWLGEIKDEKESLTEIQEREDGFRRLYPV